jgi:excinuclease ABC subunit B
VSCIYNIGSPKEYGKFIFEIAQGMTINREQIIMRLIDLQYDRGDFGMNRGSFRVKGDTITVFLAYTDEALEIEMLGDKIAKLTLVDPMTGQPLDKDKPTTFYTIYPAKHFIADNKNNSEVFKKIEADLGLQVKKFKSEGKELEAHRLTQKVTYEMDMIREVGYVKGIENYSRYFDGRSPGDAPFTLIDYFNEAYGKDWLFIVDESHITFSQVRGMHAGDLSRKQTLIDYGFRLPAALDNRPLRFEEFQRKIPGFLAVSATPGDWELSQAGREHVVEQLLRPTAIPDPEVDIKPTKHQVRDVIEEVKKRKKLGQRALITTLTKATAEDLAEFMNKEGIDVQYLHSDVATLDRTEILDNLREGKYDALVGINLLREGLDLPEVSLVAILDADKEGFLRSDVTLIQTMGRAARHKEGRVILYADRITGSMDRALKEITRRREYQLEMNKKLGLTPTSITKPIRERLINKEESEIKGFGSKEPTYYSLPSINADDLPPSDKKKLITDLRREMRLAANDLQFELAAEIRDKIKELEN